MRCGAWWRDEGGMTTPEEHALRSYVESFNRHDIDAVMACFIDNPAILDMSGKRYEGPEQVRKFYELQFALFPDGRCDINAITGHARPSVPAGGLCASDAINSFSWKASRG